MQKEKLWNKNYNKVMLTNFTLFFSFYLITPLLPLYLSETFSASKDTIGLVLSGYTLVALVIRLFSGYMVDNFARKTVLLVVLFVYFIFFGSYLIAGSLLAFALLHFTEVLSGLQPWQTPQWQLMFFLLPDEMRV